MTDDDSSTEEIDRYIDWIADDTGADDVMELSRPGPALVWRPEDGCSAARRRTADEFDDSHRAVLQATPAGSWQPEPAIWRVEAVAEWIVDYERERGLEAEYTISGREVIPPGRELST